MQPPSRIKRAMSIIKYSGFQGEHAYYQNKRRNKMTRSMKRIVTVLALFLTAGILWAQTQDMFKVTQNPDNTITITGYTGNVENVVVPSTLYGLKVTHIGRDAFRGGGVRSVVIPDTVVEIGEVAFGTSWDKKNMLTNVTIGRSVRKIGALAFCGDDEKGGSLTEITIPDSVIEIGEQAFSNQHSLTRITFGKGLQTIGDYAFSRTSLTSITLPVGLKTIGASAFSSGKAVSVSIPAGIVTVKGNIFWAQTKIVHVTLPANLSNAIMENYWFEDGLRNFYANQGRAAGTYVKNGPIWTRQ
jgi:hypothetical protein